MDYIHRTDNGYHVSEVYRLEEEKTVPLVSYDDAGYRHEIGTATIHTDGRVTASVESVSGFSVGGPYSIGLNELELSVVEQDIKQYKQARYISDQRYPEIRFEKDKDA